METPTLFLLGLCYLLRSDRSAPFDPEYGLHLSSKKLITMYVRRLRICWSSTYPE
jgi:hypothetical protein